ncbi:putative MATH/TRAF domain-containing protein [Arabidopsis thaliana]
MRSSLGVYENIFPLFSMGFLLAGFLKGYQNANYLSLFLMVATSKTLPCGWRRYTRFRLTVVNQLSDELSQQRGGFLVNNEVKIVVEVDVLQVIGKLDVSEGSQEVTQPLKRIRLNDDGVESVKRIFERHPNMALEFRAKNQHVRTSCMNVLLSLIDTLCQSLQYISIDDLGQAEKALRYLKDSDFKVDWLERKLEEVKEKKMEEQIGKSRMQELEEELKVFKQKCSDLEAQLEKEKQKCSDIEALLEKEKAKSLAAARAPPLTLDDVV